MTLLRTPSALRVTGLALLLAIAGCGTRYRLPEGVPHATLRVENLSGALVIGGAFADSSDCRGMQSFASEAEMVSGFKVPAGKPFALVLQRLDVQPSSATTSGEVGAFGLESTQCAFLPTFWPREQASYKAVMTFTGTACRLRIEEVGAAAGPSRVATVYREWTKPLDLAASACRRLRPDEQDLLRPR